MFAGDSVALLPGKGLGLKSVAAAGLSEHLCIKSKYNVCQTLHHAVHLISYLIIFRNNLIKQHIIFQTWTADYILNALGPLREKYKKLITKIKDWSRSLLIAIIILTYLNLLVSFWKKNKIVTKLSVFYETEMNS